ncbi:hypothetical protein PHJA_002969400 [Phtheirospermum japonicum]|uniref:Uncharacterized protein n=1 Tax=Phtheirospermum japonicum TaxID=374723 RepID=A0A830DLG1_9LAMI|nr:hypothetical protein PHJA_002969400 [Phtheirospermum japonicum]
MEKLLNRYDKEYLKMAMLKHEETFREQVYELHRLYQIQKMLMKDTANNTRKTATTCSRPEARQCLDLERPAERFNFPQSADKSRVSKIEDDQSDLELTLGPKSYYQKKIKAAEPAFPSDSGLSFSSSSTGSSHIKEITRTTTRDDILSQQKWGPVTPVSNNQDRLNSPPWLFQALSLNIT